MFGKRPDLLVEESLEVTEGRHVLKYQIVVNLESFLLRCELAGLLSRIRDDVLRVPLYGILAPSHIVCLGFMGII